MPVSIPITTLIFSKDRPIQLDATLHSFLMHCQDAANVMVKVLFTASNEKYAHQYQDLIDSYKTYPQITFICQKDFRRDVFNILSPFPPNTPANLLYQLLIFLPPRINHILRHCLPTIKPDVFILFLVDDNLFIKDFRLKDAIPAFQEHTDSIGFSLRLGRNTTYCYAHAVPQPLPPFTAVRTNILKFNWITASNDFNYPLEVSSSVYRLKDIIPFIIHFGFTNPNYLESGMSSRWRQFTSTLPSMLCFETSVTFCNPINMVQTVSANRTGTSQSYSAEELAKKFDQGSRIDVAAYTGFTPNACHQEVDLLFKKA